MKRINILLMTAFAVMALVGCTKEEEAEPQNGSPAAIQLENNQMSVDGRVYDVAVSLAQTGENFGARTTTIDFAVATGEYDGSIDMTAVLENRQIDLADPLAAVGGNLFDINVMDRVTDSPTPHLFLLSVSEGQMMSFVGDGQPMSGSCFTSGWTKLSHDSQSMCYELSGVLVDGRKVEMRLNVPESSVLYF